MRIFGKKMLSHLSNKHLFEKKRHFLDSWVPLGAILDKTMINLDE